MTHHSTTYYVTRAIARGLVRLIGASLLIASVWVLWVSLWVMS
jgi:hypothetical protein